jgi:hypothetical protein
MAGDAFACCSMSDFKQAGLVTSCLRLFGLRETTKSSIVVSSNRLDLKSSTTATIFTTTSVPNYNLF